MKKKGYMNIKKQIISSIFLTVFAVFGLFLIADAIGDASMTGGNFEIYADDFSDFDSAQLSGGNFVLETSGTNEGPYRATSGDISGTIVLGQALNFIGAGVFGESFYLNNGFSSTTFTFQWFAGSQTGTCSPGFDIQPCDGPVVIDIGGGHGDDLALSIAAITNAINTTTYKHGIVATNDGVDTVTMINNFPNGSAKNIVDTINDADFATSGMTASSGTYELRGGFEAQEKGILSMNLSSNSLNLGTITTAAVASSDLTVTVSTDSETGYTLSILEDGNFRAGANTIDDVADGDVTAGEEEYGIAVSGTDRDSGLAAGDLALGASMDIASSVGGVTSRVTTVTFKASRAEATNAGSYSHQVSFTLTVNP